MKGNKDHALAGTTGDGAFANLVNKLWWSSTQSVGYPVFLRCMCKLSLHSIQ